jgi:hypothetical protein
VCQLASWHKLAKTRRCLAGHSREPTRPGSQATGISRLESRRPRVARAHAVTSPASIRVRAQARDAGRVAGTRPVGTTASEVNDRPCRHARECGNGRGAGARDRLPAVGVTVSNLRNDPLPLATPPCRSDKPCPSGLDRSVAATLAPTSGGRVLAGSPVKGRHRDFSSSTAEA